MNLKQKCDLCRLCLCGGVPLINIFEEKNKQEIMLEKTIEDLINVKVVKEGGNPWFVCCTCVEKLTDFRLFKRRCTECLFVFYHRVQKGPYRGCKDWIFTREETKDKKQQPEDIEAESHSGPDGLSAKAWEIDNPEGFAEPSELLGTPEEEDPFSGISGESPMTPGSAFGDPEVQVEVKMEAICMEEEEEEGLTRGLPEECLEIVEHKLEEDQDEVPVEWTGGHEGLEDEASGASDGEWSDCALGRPAEEASCEAQGYQFSSLGCIQNMVHSLSTEAEAVLEHQGSDQLSSPKQVVVGDAEGSDSQGFGSAEQSLSAAPTPSGASQGLVPSGASSTEDVLEVDDDDGAGSCTTDGGVGSTEIASPSAIKVAKRKKKFSGFIGAGGSKDGMLEQIFQCDQCGSEFLTKRAIERHMSLHISGGFLVCGVCNMTFRNRVDYERHGVLHHGVRAVGSEKFGDKGADGSDVAGSTVPSAPPMGQVVAQISGAMPDKPFVCRICNKAFARRGNLNVHMHSHTGWKPYSCEECSSSFVTKNSLNSHMRIHTGEKPYTCTICSKSFTTSSYHTVHMRLHSGDKPYKCRQCSKAFISKNKLTLHMSVHTHDKPYSCEVCSKKFAHKRQVILHSRLHTEEKPYSCKICSKKFKGRSGLMIHMRCHNKNKPHACPLCSKSFHIKSHLKRHLSVHGYENPS